MDWSKTKNYLIILLIFANLFLGYMLYHSRSKPVEELKYTDILQIYHEKGIALPNVDISLPEHLPTYAVKVLKYSHDDVANKLGGTYTQNGDIYQYKSRKVYFLDTDFSYAYEDDFDKILTISKKTSEQMTPVYNAQKIMSEASKYLQDELPDGLLELTADKVYATDEYMVVRFVQFLGDYVFDGAYAYVYVKGSVPVGFSLSGLIEYSDSIGNNYEHITMPKMLFDVFGEFNRGDEISEISVVYSLVPDGGFKAVEGEALPYYKLDTLGGNHVYKPIYKQIGE